jgi:hypothetical protein
MHDGTGRFGIDEQPHLQPHELDERVEWKSRNESGEKDRSEPMTIQPAVRPQTWFDETPMDREQSEPGQHVVLRPR